MASPSTILLGRLTGGQIHLMRPGQLVDDTTPIPLRATTELWAPAGWRDEAEWPVVVVTSSSNIGGTFRLTAIVDGVPQDGVAAPDRRVTWTVDPPAPGQRTMRRTPIGLSRPITIDGVNYGEMGLRGVWLQLLLESIGAFTEPVGTQVPDLRFDGVTIDVVPLNRSEQVINAQ